MSIDVINRNKIDLSTNKQDNIKNIINEEIQKLVEYSQQGVYNIHDLAGLMIRMGFSNQAVGYLTKILIKTYQQGGDNAVVKKYSEMTGTNIYPISRGRYVFQIEPHDPGQEPYLEEQVLEGTGDRYAERAFGIPNEIPQWEKRADQNRYDSSMGEMVGYTYSLYGKDAHVPIFKNPLSLKNFDSDVRAVSDRYGNVFVAQQNGDFVHGAFAKVMGSDPYDGDENITWHRIDNYNVFGYSDSFEFRARYQDSDLMERMLELKRKHGFDFQLKQYDEIGYESISNTVTEKIDLKEGVGDRYAERAFGIRDTQQQDYQKQTASVVQTADMGEQVAEIWASSFGGESERHGYVYKNPKSLRGFDNDVRAIAMKNGDLYVAQQDGYFIHTDMELSLEKKIGFLDDYIELHRVGNTNTFGASDTLIHKLENYDVDSYQYIKALETRHPLFRFSIDYHQDLRETDINKVIREEIQKFSYTIPDLAELLERIGYNKEMQKNITNMLLQAYRQGGDDAVINMYKDIAGIEIQALRNGRYVFANLHTPR